MKRLTVKVVSRNQKVSGFLIDDRVFYNFMASQHVPVMVDIRSASYAINPARISRSRIKSGSEGQGTGRAMADF